MLTLVFARSVILPSFLPSSAPPASTFWLRCAAVKSQTTRAVKTPFLASRTMLMALEREGRSIGWEREDDGERAREASQALAGLGISGVEASQMEEAKAKKDVQLEKVGKVEEKDVNVRPKAPSTALMGLSMLGSTSSPLSFGLHSEHDLDDAPPSARRPRRHLPAQGLPRHSAAHSHYRLTSATGCYPALRLHLRCASPVKIFRCLEDIMSRGLR